MKIYTKKGDDGSTRLLSGVKVQKNNIRLEAYGTIDELNAFIGNLYDQKINQENKNTLFIIQNQLFNIGSNIACDDKEIEKNLPKITENNILDIEKEIDRLDFFLPKLNSFILPSGNKICSKCHIARTVCRRAERTLINLNQVEKVNSLFIKYLNRLSDYLFVLSRFILYENGDKEKQWQKK